MTRADKLAAVDLTIKALRMGFELFGKAVAKSAAHRLVRRVDKSGATVDWQVVGDDRTALFKSETAALLVITKAALAETDILKTSRELLKNMFGLVKFADLDADRQVLIRDLLSEEKWDDDVHRYGTHEALRLALADEQAEILGPELAQQIQDSKRRRSTHGTFDGERITSGVKKSRGTRFI